MRGFSRRRPDVEILMLRFANVIGPRIRTAITDYFALPVIPVPLGYDARLQFIHEDDAIAALLAATTGPSVGIVNVAGDGFAHRASSATAIVRRPIVPVPMAAAGLLGSLVKRSGLADFSPTSSPSSPSVAAWTRRGCARSFGFEPRFTTRGGVRGLRAHLAPAVPGVDEVGGAVGEARGRRRQPRVRPVSSRGGT